MSDGGGDVTSRARRICFAARVWAYLGLTFPVPATPSNDRVADAITASGSGFVVAADLSGATRESFEPAREYVLGRSAWWRWVAPHDGIMRWSAASSEKPVHVTVMGFDRFLQREVLAETYLRPKTPGGFAFGPGFTVDSSGSFQAVKDKEYWIRMDAVQVPTGSVFFPENPDAAPYRVTVKFEKVTERSPNHDAFAGRGRLVLHSPRFEMVLSAATSETGEPRGHEAALGRTLWWEWRAADRGSATIDLATSDPPPLLTVFRRVSWDRLEVVASSATEFGNECSRFWRARDRVEWDSVPETTYYVQADAFPEVDLSRTVLALLTFVRAPTNDLLASPTIVSGLDWILETTNEGATGSPEEPPLGGSAGSSTVWFRWDLPNRGLIQVTTNEPTRFAEPGVEVLPPAGNGTHGGHFTTTPGPCSAEFADLNPIPPFSPVLSIFARQGSHGDLPLLAAMTRGTNEVWSEVQGTEAWIQLDGPAGTSGKALLHGRLTPPPSNDLRAHRIVLPSSPIRVTGRTAGASTEIGEMFPVGVGLPPGVSGIPKRTVWWEWTAPTAGTWILQIGTGHLEHYFLAFRDVPHAGDTLAAATAYAPVLFASQAGEKFEIGVFAYSGLGSNLDFRIFPAEVPRLGLPLGTYHDGGGRAWWVFDGLKGWNLPFTVEGSEDLRTWMRVETDWVPGADFLRVRVDWDRHAFFVRFRAGP